MTTRKGADFPPMVTLVAPVKPKPMMAMVLPPDSGPRAGRSSVIACSEPPELAALDELDELDAEPEDDPPLLLPPPPLLPLLPLDPPELEPPPELPVMVKLTDSESEVYVAVWAAVAATVQVPAEVKVRTAVFESTVQPVVPTLVTA